MQEFHDDKMEEVKVLAEFDIEKENTFLGMGIDDFYFHVWIKSNHRDG